MPGDLAGSGARFDRWASTYDASLLQPALFAPVHQTTLQLAQHLVPHARRVLDVGCGTGRLLRQAQQRHPRAELVGVDPAKRMLAAAIAATPTDLGVHYLHAGAEHLPFTDEVFDLVVAAMSIRHWTDPGAGIAEISRVLIPGGVLVLADVFPSRPRPTLTGSMLLRRRRPSLPGELDAALTAHRPVCAFAESQVGESWHRPTGAPVRPAEPGGQPSWLFASLGGLAAALALWGGLAVLAAKRAGRRTRIGHAA